MMPSPQIPWYKLAGKYVKGKTVVDVGAGTGYGVCLLREAGADFVIGIDPNPFPPYVLKGEGEDLPEDLCDWVICIDVIEHVQDDVKFFQHLLKVARIGLFLTTPNYNVYHADNESHIREYTPEELRELLTGLKYEIWNWNLSNPPHPVSELDQCKNFGIIIWKNQVKNYE